MNKNIRILLIIFVIAVIAIISYKNYEEARIEAHYAKYLPNTFLELNSMMFRDSLLTHDEYHKFLTNSSNVSARGGKVEETDYYFILLKRAMMTLPD